MSENLIKNADYMGDLIQVTPDRLRPEHFDSDYTEGEEMGKGDEGQFYSEHPEEKVWMCDELDPEVRTEMGLDGVERAWYIVRSYTCWHGWMVQMLDLEPGLYVLTVQVYPDVYHYDNGKIPPNLHLDSPWDRAMRVRHFVGNATGIWFDESNVDGWYLNPRELMAKFTVGSAGVKGVGVEVWAPWPIKNVGLVLGPWSLERVGDVEPEQIYHVPREPYDKAVILLPQSADAEWRQAAAIAGTDRKLSIIQSADDALIGPDSRTIYAVNPEEWTSEDDDLENYADAWYPDADIIPIEAGTPYEMAVKLLPELTEDIALAQQDSRWRELSFGEQPDPPGEIGRVGCFLTGLCIVLRNVYGRDVTPPVLDRLLVMAGAAYWDDNLLDWVEAVKLFPKLDNPIKDNSAYTAGDLLQALNDGYEVILRRADGGHFVYLEDVDAQGRLRIIDTWDGKRKSKNPGDYQGIRAARVVSETPEPQHPEPAEITTLHAQKDEGGLI